MMITYRMVCNIQDDKLAHDLLRQWKFPHPNRPIGDPTVIAFWDERPVGLICTGATKDAIVCDRLAADPSLSRTGRMRMLIHLVEHYEELLKRLGVRWYHVPVDTKNKTGADSVAILLNMTPYHSDKKLTWFKREIA